jgi:tripartite-type tricarboxylate transporter receptor subunit TctC
MTMIFKSKGRLLSDLFAVLWPGLRWSSGVGAFLGVVIALALTQAAQAQDFPSRQVRLVVPVEAGGATDVQARMFASEWARGLGGPPVIIDNRPGAGGAIGADAVAKSRPDAYTVCFCSTSQLVLLPLTEKQYPFVPLRDLQPVTPVYVADGTIAVRADLGVKTLGEFIALARANPGKLSYGSTGTGGIIHLTGALIATMTGTDILHVPYKGEQPAANDLMTGRIDMVPLSALLAERMARAGKLKVLAVRGFARNPLLPEVPTMAEAGFPGAETPNHGGLLVAAGSPLPAVEKLYAAAAAVLNQAEIKERFIQGGQRAFVLRPEAYAGFLRQETEKWGKVVRSLPSLRE